MSFIELKNVCKKYDKTDKNAVTDFNLSIGEKEFVAFVGPSGCGKSTTLRMIAGFEEISSGELYIGGRKMNEVAPMDRGISMVFQNYALYPHMTVEKNISYGLKNMKVPAAEIKKKVDWAVKILGLEEYRYRKPKNLSGGQRQRVALGRAIVKNKKVFLMDEPLSNLDAKLRVQMRSEIKKLHERLNTTFIYVTHDQTEALTMGDKIVILNEGKIQQTADPETIFNYPANTFVATFMGNSPMNIIPAKIEDGILSFDRVMITLSDFNKQIIGDRKEVLIGIRPENFSPYMIESILPTGIRLHVNVESIEAGGGEKNIHFKLDDTDVTAKVNSKVNIGTVADFTIDPSDFHFFDKDTKERIV